MGIVLPWLVLIAWEGYAGGYKGGSNPCPSSDGKPCGQLPEPYRFFYATVAMAFAGVIGQFDDRAGTLFAWALVVGAFGMHYAAQQQNGGSTGLASARTLASQNANLDSANPTGTIHNAPF